MPFQRKNSNPYEFVRMERWCRKKDSDLLIGYTKNGDIYLTSDIRDNIPVFSNSSKIGNNMPQEGFDFFRLQQQNIEVVPKTHYYVNGIDKTFLFTNCPESQPARGQSLFLLLVFPIQRLVSFFI